MALYKHAKYLVQTDDAQFDSSYHPGAATPFSAIYRCQVCGFEVVSEEGKPLPPQNHHTHAAGAGPIRWQMIVHAQHKR